MMLRGTVRAIQRARPGHAPPERVRGIAWTIWRGVTAATAALVLVVWTAVPAGAAVAHDSEGPLRIPLAPMGYQAIVPEFMLAGGSALTVHFVDKDHLLITFAVRRLMKREVGDPPNDEDRTIAAFLVELPSGKVLAQTEWRVHDRSQYLWSLGHGRFLLRVHESLTTFSPLGSADPSDAFRQGPPPGPGRPIAALLAAQ